MSIASHDFDRLVEEHFRLIAQYAKVQEYCTELAAGHTREIEQLHAKIMQLRAQLIMRDTALAWAHEDRAALEAALPDLPKRVRQARHIQVLSARIQELLQERAAWQHGIGLSALAAPRVVKAGPRVRPTSILCVGQHLTDGTADQRTMEMAGGQFLHHDELDTKDEAALEASLRAADLVICQTGCLSHDAYWRVHDHCKRTGKQCVLVDQPKAIELGPVNAKRP